MTHNRQRWKPFWQRSFVDLFMRCFPVSRSLFSDQLALYLCLKRSSMSSARMLHADITNNDDNFCNIYIYIYSIYVYIYIYIYSFIVCSTYKPHNFIGTLCVYPSSIRYCFPLIGTCCASTSWASASG